MNSETVKPNPPRVFNKRRNEISVTPAIGESTSGGLISISRILNGLISLMKKPHEILPHVALETGAQAFRLLSSLPIDDQFLGLFPSGRVQPQRGALQPLGI